MSPAERKIATITRTEAIGSVTAWGSIPVASLYRIRAEGDGLEVEFHSLAPVTPGISVEVTITYGATEGIAE